MKLDNLPPEYRKQAQEQLQDDYLYAWPDPRGANIRYEEEHAVNTQERMRVSKYRNQKRRVDNITFDSKAEARRYQELKALLNAGEITKLMIQPNFILQDAFVDEDGERVRAITYRADFSYTDKDGRQIVEDVKGYKTAEYKLKAKLFRFLYRHLKLVEIEA